METELRVNVDYPPRRKSVQRVVAVVRRTVKGKGMPWTGTCRRKYQRMAGKLWRKFKPQPHTIKFNVRLDRE